MFSGVRWIVPAFLLISSAAGTAFADLAKLDPRARVALSMLRDGVTVEAAKARGASIANEGTIDAFIVGPVSRHELEAAGAQVRTEIPGGIFTAYVPPSAVEAVAALAGVKGIEGSAPVEFQTDLSVPSTGANLLRGPGPEFTGLNGQGVLVGAVDSGIDFDHPDFKDAGGLTRLVSLWDQTNAAGPGPAPLPRSTGARARRWTWIWTATAPWSWASPPATAAGPAARSRRSPTSAWPRRPACAW
jgi:subtilisin family serine protease